MYRVTVLVFLVGVSPDKQTSHRSVYVSGPGGNNGPPDGGSETATSGDDSDVTEEKLTKLMEEKMQNDSESGNINL